MHVLSHHVHEHCSRLGNMQVVRLQREEWSEFKAAVCVFNYGIWISMEESRKVRESKTCMAGLLAILHVRRYSREMSTLVGAIEFPSSCNLLPPFAIWESSQTHGENCSCGRLY